MSSRHRTNNKLQGPAPKVERVLTGDDIKEEIEVAKERLTYCKTQVEAAQKSEREWANQTLQWSGLLAGYELLLKKITEEAKEEAKEHPLPVTDPTPST